MNNVLAKKSTNKQDYGNSFVVLGGKVFFLMLALFVLAALAEDIGIFLPEAPELEADINALYQKSLTDRNIGNIRSGGDAIINWGNIDYRRTHSSIPLTEWSPLGVISDLTPANTPHALILVKKDGVKVFMNVDKRKPYKDEIAKVKNIIAAVIQDYDSQQKIRSEWQSHK